MTLAFEDCGPDRLSSGDTEDSSRQRWNKSSEGAQSWLPRGPAGHRGSEPCRVMHGCLWPATLCGTPDHLPLGTYAAWLKPCGESRSHR